MRNSAREMETVVVFSVNLNWGGYRETGVTSVNIHVDGVSTSSEAIDKAIGMVKVLREDYPRSVSASMDSYEREIPKALAATSANVIDVSPVDR